MQQPQLVPFDPSKVSPGDTIYNTFGQPRRFIAGPSPDGKIVVENEITWYFIDAAHLRLLA